MSTTGSDLQFPRQFVADGWDFFQGLASSTLDAALRAAERMQAFPINIEPIAINATFDDIPIGDTFSVGPAPTPPDLSATFPTIPDFVPGMPLNDVTLPPVPESGNLDSVLSLTPPGGEPGPLDVAAPVRPIVDLNAVFPDAPVLALPAVPVLRPVEIPNAPDILTPAFTAELPTFDAVAPQDTFVFDEPPYSSALLDATRNKILAVMQGIGLPPEIEQQLLDQSLSREDATGQQALREAINDFVSRGFEEPNGVLTRRLDTIRQDTSNRRAEANRAVTVQNKQLYIENVRFAVSQGIALEQLLINLHSQQAQRALEAARATVDASVAIFNAQVARFQVARDLFAARVQEFEAKLRAELAQLDVFRAKIEGQRAVAEVNQAIVSTFEVQIRGERAKVDLFNARVDAESARLQAAAQQLEGFRSEVQAFEAQVRAKAAEWDGFRSRNEAFGSQVRSFEAAANVFGSRVRAWSDQSNALMQNQRVKLEQEELRVQQFQARLQAVSAAIDAELNRVRTSAEGFRSQTDAFRAEVDAASARSQAIDRATTLAITREDLRVQTELRNAQARITQAIQRANLQLEALRGSSAATAQLAASAMSGVNFGAGVSESFSNSFSKSVNFTFSGQTSGTASP